MKRDTPDYIKSLARDQRKRPTITESILWQKLRSYQLWGYKFRRQYGIGRYILDFYCHNVRLAIEIDGEIHEQPERVEYDRIRDKELESRGIKTIRFTNSQILNELDSVLITIDKYLMNQGTSED